MPSIGALIITIGFWGSLYYNYNKEPPKIVLAIMKAPFLGIIGLRSLTLDRDRSSLSPGS